MAFFTICGKPDCPQFAHATYVAQYLTEHLPNFRYLKIIKSNSEWPEYVSQLNKRNHWFMVRSPIIWKEISSWGGKPYLLGNLAQFWEYCFCYYGLNSYIPKADLEKLANDNVQYFEEAERRNSTEQRKYNICITVLLSPNNAEYTLHLIEHIIKIPQFLTGNGLLVKLLRMDKENCDEKRERKSLENIADYYNSLALCGDRSIVEVQENEEQALTKCDLLLFAEDFSRKQNEEEEIWLRRCLTRIICLSDMIHLYAKRQLRVLFCNEGPMCFMATCLLESCTALIPTNIIALTSYKGLPVINVISQKTGVPVSRIGAPPVWGFVGTNEYVDESSIVFKANIFKPYRRTLTASKNSTLALGTVLPELRLMSYLVPDQHEAITKAVLEKKTNIEAKLHRKPFQAKLRAFTSLLELWYANLPSNQIISLAVCSDGSYGIPPGLIFSQCCIQDLKRRWRPFSNCPFVNKTVQDKLEELVEEALEQLKIVGLFGNVDFYHSNSFSDLDDVP